MLGLFIRSLGFLSNVKVLTKIEGETFIKKKKAANFCKEPILSDAEVDLVPWCDILLVAQWRRKEPLPQLRFKCIEWTASLSSKANQNIVRGMSTTRFNSKLNIPLTQVGLL